MKKIIIVESPAKIKTIRKFLGKEFVILSTMGHIKDLPQKKIGVSVDNGIDIEYVALEKKEKVIADICKNASGADMVYLAPDPDREGEIIAWHIGQEIEKVISKKTPIYRISFNEITKPAILQAIDNPGSINLQLVAAQQARRVLDRWVGYEVSPILWRKISPGLSAGRVQSVVLLMICKREKAITSFKPQEYWSITGIFTHNRASITTELTHIDRKKIDISDKKTATSTVKKIEKESFTVTAITDKKRIKNPSPPFMTSTLQQDAFNKLGFTVKKTMHIAQQLYEGIPLDDPKTPIALITYMRTDSLRISDVALKQVRSYITKHFSKQYLPLKALAFTKKKGKIQDAHEAIRPIDVTLTPPTIKKHLSSDAAKLYGLIWKRFVACQMKSAQYMQRQLTIEGGIFVFKTTGSTLLFDGFLRVYDSENEKEEKIIIPAGMKKDSIVILKKIDPKQHFTQPPPRYTEASLIKELVKEGIGRPSTYVAILNTIRARAYTTLEKKRFVPTDLGIVVTDMLVNNLPKIMDIKFTAFMEEDLDKIAHGELKRDTLLKKFYKAFQKDISTFAEEKKGKKALATDITCPQCKKEQLSIRFTKTGKFLGCTGYPACSFTSNFTRNEQGKIELIEPKKSEPLKDHCPKCNLLLRKVSGRFGDFVACSGYPECKYIQRKKAFFSCPECKGIVVEKKWRGGIFWGCENYPTCKFAIFDALKNESCPSCKWPFLVIKTPKDKKEYLICHNKKCSYSTEKK